MKCESKTVAFFDLDDTIVVGTNTLYLYVKYLVRRGEMSRFQVLRGIVLSALHKLNLVNIEKMLDKLAKPYKGKKHQDMRELTQQWFHSDVIPYISEEAIEKIRWHKMQGHTVVLLSNATQYICSPVKQYLNMDHSINTVVEVENGILTGKLQKPMCYQEGKVLYAKAFCHDRGLDIKDAYFYTDSITDLPMLEEVAHPVPVNPDPLLRREAKKRGWESVYWSETSNSSKSTKNPTNKSKAA